MIYDTYYTLLSVLIKKVSSRVHLLFVFIYYFGGATMLAWNQVPVSNVGILKVSYVSKLNNLTNENDFSSFIVYYNNIRERIKLQNCQYTNKLL